MIEAIISETTEYQVHESSEILEIKPSKVRANYDLSNKVERAIFDASNIGYPIGPQRSMWYQPDPNNPDDFEKPINQEVPVQFFLNKDTAMIQQLPLERFSDIASRNQDAAFLLRPIASLLDDYRVMPVDASRTQDQVSPHVLKVMDELVDLKGIFAYQNGWGASSSCITNHGNIINLSEFDGLVRIRKELTDPDSHFSLEEAPEIYKNLLKAGHPVSISALGNGRAGFVIHKNPFKKNGNELQVKADLNSVSQYRRGLFLASVFVGIGGLEATLDNVFTNKNGYSCGGIGLDWTPEQYMHFIKSRTYVMTRAMYSDILKGLR